MPNTYDYTTAHPAAATAPAPAAPATPAAPISFQDWMKQNGGNYLVNPTVAQQRYQAYVNGINQKATQNQQLNNDLLPGYQQRDASYQQAMAQGLAGQTDLRQRQGTLADYLGGLVQGKDSLSAQQLRQGADKSLQQQQALQASAAPGNQALAARMASQNAGRIGMDLTGQTAMSGIAERQAAANSLSGLLGGARGQDLSLMGGQAQLQLQNALGQQQGGQTYEQQQLAKYLQDQQNSLNWNSVLGAALPVVGHLLPQGGNG
jgi:hypothetical protein